jgi:hypothetical protein
MHASSLRRARRSRRLGHRAIVTIAILGAALTGGTLTALAAAGSGTVDGPPRMAFVARSDVPADALAAGPVAGRFGAPIFTTPPSTLVPAAVAGLQDLKPELVVLLGSEGALSKTVETQVQQATGLPADMIIRAGGADRHETAKLIYDLIAKYDPAFLPVGATALGAVEADTAEVAADALLLDGREASTFQNENQILSATVDQSGAPGPLNPKGALKSGRHAVAAEKTGTGEYLVEFDRGLVGCARVATVGQPTTGTHTGYVAVTEMVPRTAGRGGDFVYVQTRDLGGGHADAPFHLVIICSS